jgi:tungstate transport system ATP-binding protein
MTPAVILQAKRLEVDRGGKTVLSVADLEIRQGETLALIGPNGAGKTTLLLALASLLQTVRGQVLFKGQPVTSKPAGLVYRRRQAMVFQEPLLFSTTVFENVATGLKLRGVAKDRIYRLVQDNLARFGIGHLAQRPARKISGGEAQRTSLARALATQPEILFLDEPFAALDPPTREALVEDLGSILQGSGITAVMTTHDYSEALRLSSRMAVMDRGRILQLDDPTTVFHRPANRLVAEFVGVDNLIAGTVIQSENESLLIDMQGIRIQARGRINAGTKVTLCVRPESVRLLGDGRTSGNGTVNAFAGRILRVIPMGHFYKFHLNCGFALTAVSTGSDGAGRRVGDRTTIAIPPSGIHIIADQPAA